MIVRKPESGPLKVERSAAIFVEGPDDAYLFEAIASSLNLADAIQIIPYREIGELRRVLDVFVRDSNFSSVHKIGLTRDSDDNPGAAVQSLRDAWQDAVNTIRVLGLHEPRSDVLTIPATRPGRIENLCLEAPAFPAILACAEQMYDCAIGVANHQIDREKAVISTYLSMMGQQGLRLWYGGSSWLLEPSGRVLPPTEGVRRSAWKWVARRPSVGFRLTIAEKTEPSCPNGPSIPCYGSARVT